jgi:hypothetical protein
MASIKDKKKIVDRLKQLLVVQGWEITRSFAKTSNLFYGCYLKNIPLTKFKYLWVGALNNFRGADGIFVMVAARDVQIGFKLLDEGFKLFPFWAPHWWFIKRLISNRNVVLLKGKSDDDVNKTLETILLNTFPFAD